MNSKELEGTSIKYGSVQYTMLGPLWARAIYTQKYPELLDDKKAVEIHNKITVDLSEMEDYLQEWRALGLMMRAKSFDIALMKYLEKYPEATVVNLGCGLDTTFSRIDNGKIKWYDLDLPEAIEYRKQFIHESSRNIFIAKSVLDYSWFDDIEFDQKKGIFFIAGGLIYYFNEEEIKELFIRMTRRYPGGEIIFDALSKLAIWISEKRIKKYVKQGQIKSDEVPHGTLSIGNPNNIFPKWSEKIKLLDWHLGWDRIPPNPAWEKNTLKMIKMVKFFKTAKIVLLQFIK
ncbi:MAG: class I SAM-dependent methyltransferase [Candidatus Hodarchaeota archaeon]